MTLSRAWAARSPTPTGAGPPPRCPDALAAPPARSQTPPARAPLHRARGCLDCARSACCARLNARQSAAAMPIARAIRLQGGRAAAVLQLGGVSTCWARKAARDAGHAPVCVSTLLPLRGGSVRDV
eukprot:CAMPEP_0202824564 /NCGR_PEP_ID=MMETSP1389-20130828/12439_1 /ASSEMBLY_ACC=CAM_ASM_000865 /TAXON_ID=302021 /ORGANISM="Rhodomonas sp., Strain CCMP768" /LENGTH=125 /DNA_ID=CAMNT_0049497677 /DNA_START=42 /DNA_END=420 /DNA_ORIENTATION=-